MAEFASSPSWLTTLRYLAHCVMPERFEAKGFAPLSVRERDALLYPLLAVRILMGVFLAFGALLTVMAMTTSFIGALVVSMCLFVGVPLIVVTVAWLGLKAILNDEGK